MRKKIPHHVAIIMDGNGRWAKKRGLFRTKGHMQGAKRVKEVVREAQAKGIKVLTLFAFSTENWDRPKRERDYLFTYLKNFLVDYQSELVEKKIKFKAFGRRDRMKADVVSKIEAVEAATLKNSSFFLNIALDYGGRWDIVNATKKIAELVSKGVLKKEEIDEKLFARYLFLTDLGEPDMLVRTSGEKRISNFIIWQLAYSELYFPEVLWPDFTKEWVSQVICEYSRRRRTFGKVTA